MTSDNIFTRIRKNFDQFSWYFWFPYPISWVRTILLIPVALPGTRLILIGFGGSTISLITNNLELLIFFLFSGFILPIVILSFLYHFIWFIWQKENKKRKFPYWLPSRKSLWEGFYATVVICISFSLIFIIFLGLSLVSCQLSYQSEDMIGRCSGRFLGNAFGPILRQVENNSFQDKPWFFIWFAISLYIYQVEYLMKQRILPNLKKKYVNKRKNY
jgi:hypothetical protein